MAFHAQFSDNNRTRRLAQANKGYSYLLITKASRADRISYCDAATAKALETGGMKRGAPAAVRLEARFSVLLDT